MSDSEYWIIRHGERYDFKHPIMFNLFNFGAKKRDTWLTDCGQKNALILGKQIVNVTTQMPEVIVSSPYLRCIQTSQAIQRAFQEAGRAVPLIIDTSIAEFQPLFPESTYMYPDGIPGFAGLETLSSMIQRSHDAADSIKAKYKRAIIVSHTNIVYHMSLKMLDLNVPISYTSEVHRGSQVGYVAYSHVGNTTPGTPLTLLDTNIKDLGAY
jgi:broad specificity phosphatase PhoE